MAPGSASFPSGSHHLDPVELISNHVLRTEVDLMFDYVSEKNLVISSNTFTMYFKVDAHTGAEHAEACG